MFRLFEVGLSLFSARMSVFLFAKYVGTFTNDNEVLM